jgi:hypothetical protein
MMNQILGFVGIPTTTTNSSSSTSSAATESSSAFKLTNASGTLLECVGASDIDSALTVTLQTEFKLAEGAPKRESVLVIVVDGSVSGCRVALRVEIDAFSTILFRLVR